MVSSVHNLWHFVEGKNHELSSGCPSANPSLTPIAARSPLPVSDVPRASAMSPLQAYCAQGHFWASLAEAFGVSPSDTLSHAQLPKKCKRTSWPEKVQSCFPPFIFPGKRGENVTCWDMADLHLHPHPVEEGKKKKKSSSTQHIWKVSGAQSRHLQMSPSVTLFIRGPSSSLG